MSATRSFATLASRALVRPTYTTSLRNGAISNVDSLCQRGLKSAATASATWARAVGHKTGQISFAQRISTSRVNQLQQVRWQSQKGEGETPELKRWGFEDVCYSICLVVRDNIKFSGLSMDVKTNLPNPLYRSTPPFPAEMRFSSTSANPSNSPQPA